MEGRILPGDRAPEMAGEEDQVGVGGGEVALGEWSWKGVDCNSGDEDWGWP